MLRLKNFSILGVHWKIRLFFLKGGGGGGSRKTNIDGGLSKRGKAWAVCQFKAGGLGKKEEGGVFEAGRGGGGVIGQCKLCKKRY